jgi:transcriptional regulator with XRE-family HTH domain
MGVVKPISGQFSNHVLGCGMTIGNRLREALTGSSYTLKAASEELGVPYSTLRRYLDDERYPPPTTLLVAAADLCGISPEWLLTGLGSKQPDRTMAETLEASSESEVKRVSDAWSAISSRLNPTPTEEQAFRSYLARWLMADPIPTLEDRIARMESLAGMLESPLAIFGAGLDARRMTDYRLGMLQALGLAMPERD